MKNFWIERAESIVEREVLLISTGPLANRWFAQMSPRIPTWIKDSQAKYQVGWTHSIRLTSLGIEGVIRTARKYQRYPHALLRNMASPNSSEEFVVILEKS
jgi:hypothetical protein